MANTVYANKIIEAKAKDLLLTSAIVNATNNTPVAAIPYGTVTITFT